MGEKKIGKVFPYFFFAYLIFLVNISIAVTFFHGRLRSCEIFWCVKMYWMYFHQGSSRFSKEKIALHYYIKWRYLFLDSRFLYLAGEDAAG